MYIRTHMYVYIHTVGRYYSKIYILAYVYIHVHVSLCVNIFSNIQRRYSWNVVGPHICMCVHQPIQHTYVRTYVCTYVYSASMAYPYTSEYSGASIL